MIDFYDEIIVIGDELVQSFLIVEAEIGYWVLFGSAYHIEVPDG